MKEYFTLPKEVVANELVIEKSRFICYAKGIDSVEEATEFLSEVKKKNYDATHNCYAYVCFGKAKFSDDGEPQGTAGQPMYETLKNSGVDGVVAVVTRYFGGVKLGAGGLVRAYSAAVADCLKKAGRVEMRECKKLFVEIDYSLLKTVRRALEGKAVEESVSYGARVAIEYLILSQSETNITDIVVEKTGGKAKIVLSEPFLSQYGES